MHFLSGIIQILINSVPKKMVVDGGTIDVTQPIQMADTTGVDITAGTWQSTAQTMVWCG